MKNENTAQQLLHQDTDSQNGDALLCIYYINFIRHLISLNLI